ncbi:hypothetical protein W97_08536 [Coniosporium apollinis CBS 100218]|uniref:Uncharacterized protein n=1 Tax=Coniosporium apollinis (strain CBS 100218) TaxID=1168221 RepID=R7Z509_CONA1|nr:uncharacterized protein W97_08536 [Coniosporium apollinis CBS 100218]EON69178.1 hypothetical protein W97_08536 [Coniosporium apollinis CBS 100218]
MSDRNSPPLPSPGASERRRASFSATAFSDLFGRSPSNATAQNPQNPQNPPTAYPGPITSAAAQANRRRLSLTTLGLSGSPTQSSSFGMPRSRGDSVSSANTGSVDESPFEEEDHGPTSASTAPNTPFARRLSFGARALRDVKQSNGNGHTNGRRSPSTIKTTTSPPTAAKSRGLSSSHRVTFASSENEELPHAASPRGGAGQSSQPVHALTGLLDRTGDGYNFAENLRTRAERMSISGSSGAQAPTRIPHQRAKSVAVMEPPKQMPKSPVVPDAFGERMLKGDFYMD